jgi:hypothetical protein
MSLKCTGNLRVACHNLKDSKHTETVDCFTLIFFNPTSKFARSQSTSCGKMPASAG